MKALYSFSKGTSEGLSVKFTDRSLDLVGTPTYSWSMPGATPATANTTNPEVVYGTAGTKLVTLTLTSGAVTSKFTQEIVVLEDGNVTYSIYQLIKNQFPEGFDYNHAYGLALTQYWQNYIHEFISPAIAAADIYEESKWPTLANYLISKLVIYSLVEDGAKKAPLQGKGDLKRIETGPSNAEWHDPSKYYSVLFTGTTYENFLKETCGLARRLKVTLPFCPKLKTGVLFQIFKPHC